MHTHTFVSGSVAKILLNNEREKNIYHYSPYVASRRCNDFAFVYVNPIKNSNIITNVKFCFQKLKETFFIALNY